MVQGLDAEALTHQSGSDEWTVADVLSHLGSGAEIGLGTLTAGKADMEGAQAIWARWNAMSPTEQAESFVVASERLAEAFEALDEATLTDGRIELGFLPAPVEISFFAAMRLSEVGQHFWDVAVAFDPDATVPDYVVPFAFDLILVFAGFFAKPSGKTGRVAVETVDPVQHFVLELIPEGATLSEGTAKNCGTRATMPAEAFLRLAGGRLDAAHTPPGVLVEGDLTIDDLRTTFPGY